jgi:hypothetical protein
VFFEGKISETEFTGLNIWIASEIPRNDVSRFKIGSTSLRARNEAKQSRKYYKKLSETEFTGLKN